MEREASSGTSEEVSVLERPRHRPRVPCIAAVLGFLVPGLGHMYAGIPKRGVIWYIAASIFPAVLAMTGLQFSFRGLLMVLSLELVLSAIVMLDGARVARRQGAVMLESWQRWWIYGLIILVAFTFSMVMRITVERTAMGIRAFKIPSESMEPGLLVGDHLMVSIAAYKNKPPGRGDIVVFRHPKQPDIFYIKRVAAVGGDTVALRGKRLYVNGSLVDEPYLPPDEGATEQEAKNFGPVTVGEGTLFVLGDNRPNSYDSRQWGVLEEREIVGRALYIYWSWDSFQKAPRMERIGMAVK